MSTVGGQETYLLGEASEQELAAQVFDFLAAHEVRHGARPATQYALVGADAHDRVELPRDVHLALVQIVAALKTGRAVTVAPQSTTLTTQQTADLLGVSRPTVVKLIERGELPHERVGSRRRLLLHDVLDYRARRRAAAYDAIAASLGDADDVTAPEKVIAAVKEARGIVAARRRG